LDGDRPTTSKIGKRTIFVDGHACCLPPHPVHRFYIYSLDETIHNHSMI